MELVYLWVDKYKNIKDQGFNFNQNINCTFDYEIKDGGTEDGVFDHKVEIGDVMHGILNIPRVKDNTNTFNIFPHNINVTAIIGKNGSGKSSILEFILFFLTQEKHLEKKYRGILVLKDKSDNFIVYSKIDRLVINGDNILHSDLNKFKITDYNDEKELNKLFQSLIFPYLNYSLTYHDILNYTSRMNDDAIKLHFPMIPDKRYGKIDMVENDRNIEKIILNTYKTLPDEDKVKIYDDFFKPKYVEVYVNYSQIEKENDKLKDTIREQVLEKISESKSYFKDNKNKEGIDTLYDILKLKSNPTSYKSTLNNEDFSVSEPIGLFNIHDSYPSPNELNQIDNHVTYASDTLKMVKNNLQTQSIMKFEIDDVTESEIDFLTSLKFPYFDIEVIDETEKRYSSLSFGERQLIALINQVFWFGTKEYKETVIQQYHVPVMDYDDAAETLEVDDEVNVPIDKYIILLDEIDLSFHPEWQKRTLKYLLDVLGRFENKSFHLIFSSHSPFLLSDIPKENVIFLDKYKKDDEEVIDDIRQIGDCKIINGLDNKEKTFATNIHTLLCDSFFMGNNLMGDFSRTKIQSIVEFHEELEERVKYDDIANIQNDYEDKKEEFAYIKGIIGDQYIANVVQNHIEEIEKNIYGEQYIEEYKDNEIKKLLVQFDDAEIRRLLDKHK